MDDAASRGGFPESRCIVSPYPLVDDHRRGGAVGVDADRSVDLNGFVEHHIDALWLVRQGGTVIYLNAKARRLALAGYPVTIAESGRLVVAEADAQIDLGASIIAAVSRPPKSSIFTCEGRGRSTFRVSVAPAGRRIEQNCAVILIRDLTEVAKLRSEVAEALYSLTPSEVRVLEALLKGLTPQEVAAATGTKITTVRTQIAAVMSKAGVKRQADLLAQVFNFPGL